MPHDDFVNIMNGNFNLKNAQVIRNRLQELCKEKFIDKESLIMKKRKSHSMGICSDIYLAFKILVGNSSTLNSSAG